MKRPWGGGTSWLAHHVLFSLLSDSTQDHHPRGGFIHNVLAHSHQLLIKKVPHRPAYSQSYGGIFSIEGSLPDNSSMFEVDKKNLNRGACVGCRGGNQLLAPRPIPRWR